MNKEKEKCVSRMRFELNFLFSVTMLIWFSNFISSSIVTNLYSFSYFRLCCFCDLLWWGGREVSWEMRIICQKNVNLLECLKFEMKWTSKKNLLLRLILFHRNEIQYHNTANANAHAATSHQASPFSDEVKAIYSILNQQSINFFHRSSFTRVKKKCGFLVCSFLRCRQQFTRLNIKIVLISRKNLLIVMKLLSLS